MRFYRICNSAFAKTRGANSELLTVELMASYCLPFLLYSTDAIPLSDRTVSVLDNYVSTAAIAKICSVAYRDNILCLGELMNLPKQTVWFPEHQISWVSD